VVVCMSWLLFGDGGLLGGVGAGCVSAVGVDVWRGVDGLVVLAWGGTRVLQ